MAFGKRIISYLKDLDQRIQFARISIEDEGFRDYILKKYHKKKCPYCNGKGFFE